MPKTLMVSCALLLAVLGLTSCSSGHHAGVGASSAAKATCDGTGPTYKIGFQGPLSGANAAMGTAELNAVELAVGQATAARNLCFSLAVLSADDRGTAAGAPVAAAKLIDDPAVVGVVGPALSGPATASGAQYTTAGLALISPSATNSDLTSSGFTTFHRAIATDEAEAEATASYLAARYTSVYVIDDTSPYGLSMGEVVRADLAASRIKIDSQSVAPVNDYSALAKQVVASGDAAMYYAGADAQAALLATALKTAGYTGFEIAGSQAMSNVFTMAAGAAGNGFHFACGCLDAATAPAAATFAAQYQAKFQVAPARYSAEAYDATNALIAAIGAAKSPAVSRASAESAVNAVDYDGIAGPVKFLASGELERPTTDLYEQQNGKIGWVGNMSAK